MIAPPGMLAGITSLSKPLHERLSDAADASHEASRQIIDQDAVKGEPGTGFEKRGQKGLFECGNCEYFDAVDGACNQKDMIAKSKQPRLSDGRPSVAPEDCCEYVDRVEKENG